VPAVSNGVGGRVITGVAPDDVNSRLTPVALAMPAPLNIDFAVYWAPTYVSSHTPRQAIASR
jgi:hypothetical protein